MYYYIANFQNNKFEVLRQCSEEEYKYIDQLKESISTILFRANRRIYSLNRAYKKMSIINIALKKQTGEFNQNDLGDAIMLAFTFCYQKEGKKYAISFSPTVFFRKCNILEYGLSV